MSKEMYEERLYKETSRQQLKRKSETEQYNFKIPLKQTLKKDMDVNLHKLCAYPLSVNRNSKWVIKTSQWETL